MTVRVSEDDDAVTDAAVTLTHTVTGADEYENPDTPFTISPVTVTPKENDMRGVSGESDIADHRGGRERDLSGQTEY